MASRYEIIKKLSLKPESQTYLAKDTYQSSPSLCVIKQIYPAIGDPDLQNKMRTLVHKEVDKLYQLHSFSQTPNLLNDFVEDNAFYLVQEWIQGIPLAQDLETSGTYAEEKVVYFLRQALLVLHRIHQIGIIHQDLKPENWMYLPENNKYVLVDFGKIVQLEIHLAMTIPIDNNCYVAPEQLRNHPKPASDLYSLGMMALQAFTGQNPVSLPENEQGRLIWELETLQDSPLVPIINKMIAPNITERYGSTREILEVLAVQFPPMRPPYNPNNPTKVVNSQSSPSSPTIQSPPPNSASVKTVEMSPPQHSAQTVQSVPTPTAISEPQHSAQTVQSISTSTSQPNSSSPAPQWSILFNSPWAKGIGMVGALFIFLVTISQFMQWQTNQKITEKIEEITALYEEEDYQKCVAESRSSDTIQLGVSKAKRLELKSKCLLGLANEEANQLQHAKAINLAMTIPDDSPYYQEAQAEIDNWSTNILQQTEKFYKDTNNLSEAEERLKEIPETSAVKKQALEQLKQWQEERLDSNIRDICKEGSVLCSQ
ncbi:MAG: AarF/UbiB family protein [Microcystaceae cyanobacterium]